MITLYTAAKSAEQGPVGIGHGEDVWLDSVRSARYSARPILRTKTGATVICELSRSFLRLEERGQGAPGTHQMHNF